MFLRDCHQQFTCVSRVGGRSFGGHNVSDGWRLLWKVPLCRPEQEEPGNKKDGEFFLYNSPSPKTFGKTKMSKEWQHDLDSVNHGSCWVRSQLCSLKAAATHTRKQLSNRPPTTPGLPCTHKSDTLAWESNQQTTACCDWTVLPLCRQHKQVKKSKRWS